MSANPHFMSHEYEKNLSHILILNNFNNIIYYTQLAWNHQLTSDGGVFFFFAFCLRESDMKKYQSVIKLYDGWNILGVQ